MGWDSFFRRLFSGAVRVPRADLLFVGLGNPGSGYASTRHNIGFRVAAAFGERLENKKNGCFGAADFHSGTLFNKRIVVMRPRTFMNRSGEAVDRYVKGSGVPVTQALVMVDDYHLSLGRLRCRRNGSDGGHNGLASIIEKAGDGFPRLRIGIGPLPPGRPSVEFVLGPFSTEEEERLREVIPRAVEACLCFAEGGIDEMMNRFNT